MPTLVKDVFDKRLCSKKRVASFQADKNDLVRRTRRNQSYVQRILRPKLLTMGVRR